MKRMIMAAVAAVASLTALADVAKGVFDASPGRETVTVGKVTASSAGTLQPDADTLVYRYTFPAPTFEENGDGTASVHMNGIENSVDVGLPSLPSLPVRLAIPKGREVLSVDADGELEQVAAGVLLRHVDRPVPTDSGETDETARDESVYGSDELYPGKRLSGYDIASKRGVRFVDFRLSPVAYKGLSGEVWYCPEVTVVLSLKPQGAGTPRLLAAAASGSDAPRVRSKADTDAAMALLDNPEEVESYVPKTAARARLAAGATAGGYSSIPYAHPALPCRTDSDFPDGYRHVVVTTQELLGAFEQLVMYRRRQGVSSTAVTVEQITATYSGVDTQEQIRNFIKDAYENWNTEYVVLGGDTGQVPARMLYGNADGKNRGDIPSDWYYQGLDGDFNANGNSVWGEVNDNVDWYAEVALGRVPAENAYEVNCWYSKLVRYNRDVASDAAYTHRMLSLGEDMYWDGYRYASSYLEQIRTGCTYLGYTTKGFDGSATYTTRDTLYDSKSYTWPKSELIAKINANQYAVISHLGHGFYNCNMKLYTSDVDNQIRNTAPLFIYSSACLSGAFDENCIAEHLLTSSEYGCFGGVWNSRIGWYYTYSIDGPSHRFARHFWNAAFTVADTNNGTTGLANQLAHERNAGGNSYYRWVYYASNLFGDPIQQIDGVTLTGVDPQLQIERLMASFPAGGGDGSIEVTASGSWTAETSDPWIRLGAASGSGNGTLAYSVPAYAEARKRYGAITVRCGAETAVVVVDQAPPLLRLDSGYQSFSADAASGSFKVESDSMWTVETSEDWIHLDQSAGNGNGTVTYRIDENAGKYRNGVIYITSGGVRVSHTVAQDTRARIAFSALSAEVPSSGGSGSFTFTVWGRMSWPSWGYSQVSWAKWSYSEQWTDDETVHTCTYSVEENPSASTRSVGIPISFNEEEYVFTITQAPAGGLVLTGNAKVGEFRRDDDGSWTLVFEIDATDAGGTITEASFAVKTGTDINALDANADFEIVKTETSGDTVTVTVRIAPVPDDTSPTRFFTLGGK